MFANSTEYPKFLDYLNTKMSTFSHFFFLKYSFLVILMFIIVKGFLIIITTTAAELAYCFFYLAPHL